MGGSSSSNSSNHSTTTYKDTTNVNPYTTSKTTDKGTTTSFNDGTALKSV